MAIKGNKITATEAFQLGLVNQVVKPETLDAAVEAEILYYANEPTKAIALIKKMLQKGATHSLDDTLEYEAYCQQIAGNTYDFKEEVGAFLEKRKAEFKEE